MTGESNAEAGLSAAAVGGGAPGGDMGGRAGGRVFVILPRARGRLGEWRALAGILGRVAWLAGGDLLTGRINDRWPR